MGVRLRDLGSEQFTWSDLRDFVRYAPRDSALNRSRYGEDSQWGVAEHLLALLADAATWIAWSKTEDGHKGRNRPKPIPRPGVDPRGQSDIQLMTADEMRAFLVRPRHPVNGA